MSTAPLPDRQNHEHSSVAFTMDTDQHLMPTMHEQAVHAIEEAIGGTVAAGLEDV